MAQRSSNSLSHISERSFCKILQLALGTIVAICTVVNSASLKAQAPSEDQIQSAINLAIGNLKKRLPHLKGGESALVAMALLKSGESLDDPVINDAIGRILAQITGDEFRAVNHHIYEAGVSIMALANADPVKYRPQIQTIARFIVKHQQEPGGWYYPDPPSKQLCDTSITQYAILGLWEAARAGVPIPKKTWDLAAAFHVRYQNENGSYSYHPVQGSLAYGDGGRHTMTVAGIGSLYVARMYLYPSAQDVAEEKEKGKARRPTKSGKKYGVLEPNDPTIPAAPVVKDILEENTSYRVQTRLAAIDKAIGSGTTWMKTNYSIDLATGYSVYYLYGIERWMALADLKEFNGRDWYADGAARLIRTFSGDGWNDTCGPDAATAFGLLFLKKATAKMVTKSTRRGVDKKLGGGVLIGGRGLPDDLGSIEVDRAGVRVRKMKGPVDELLAELEKSDGQQLESVQAALVETIATEDPEALIGQTNRLVKLLNDKRVEVRRTVLWALGRTNDLRIVPKIIGGLSDPDPSCVVEARNALQYISKNSDAEQPPDDFTEDQRNKAVVFWKKWYQNVRAYDERDDLTDVPSK